MKLLLAAPDRDLLTGLQTLLTLAHHEVRTAFDGLQTVTHVERELFDLVLLDLKLPRIDPFSIIRLQSEKRIPTVALSDRRTDVPMLLRPDLPTSYLSYPFLPEELLARIDAVHSKAVRQESLLFGDASVTLPDFCLSGGSRVTNEEIDVLTAIRDKTVPAINHPAAYVGALNEKLSRAEKAVRIQYIKEEGYRLVTDYE